MRIILLALLLIPYGAYAAESISCHFYKFHQVNHEAPEMSGYADIDQSLEIVNGRTSEATLKLDGKKRGTNSSIWVRLELEGWNKYLSTYAGDFGELLTIEHELDGNSKGLNGWYKSSLVSSNIKTTHTSIGKCSIK